jgi:hypothetical protein
MCKKSRRRMSKQKKLGINGPWLTVSDYHPPKNLFIIDVIKCRYQELLYIGRYLYLWGSRSIWRGKGRPGRRRPGWAGTRAIPRRISPQQLPTNFKVYFASTYCRLLQTWFWGAMISHIKTKNNLHDAHRESFGRKEHWFKGIVWRKLRWVTSGINR